MTELMPSAFKDSSASRVLDRNKILGGVLLVVALLVYWQNTALMMFLALGMLLVIAIINPKNRLFLVIMLLAAPYALGAYVAAGRGVTYYPHASYSEYLLASTTQVTGIILASSLVLFFGLSEELQVAVLNVSRSIQVRSHRIFFGVAAYAFVVGVHDFLILVSNHASLFANGRHVISSDFWNAQSPIGIVLSVAISISLFAGMASSSSRNIAVLALFTLWAPSIVAGERNYATLSAIMASVILISRAPSARTRRRIVFVLVGTVPLAMLVPVFWSENAVVAFNEWILPNSQWVPLVNGFYSTADLGNTPFWSQARLMLPSVLRGGPVVTRAEVFDEMGVVNVGVGGNLWADVYEVSRPVSVLLFATAIACLVVLALCLFRFGLSCAPLLLIGVMGTLGRWGFWGLVFVVVYGSLCSALLVKADSCVPHDARQWCSGSIR